MTEAAAVQKLLLSHVGLGPRLPHRHLFTLPSFSSLESKQALLAHACLSQCSAVVEDVLLFLSQTLSEPLFLRELRLPQHQFAVDHWANYLRQQQRLHASSYAALQDYPLVAFFRGVGRYTDMTTEILQLLLAQSDVARVQEWAREADTLLDSSHQPAWLRDQVGQYIQLQLWIRDTEAKDAAIAPPEQTLSGWADQRQIGSQGLKWGKRHVQLTATYIAIQKHEPDKVERSVNPFLDKRQECISLAADMQVQCRHHASSTHATSLDRPYCIELVRPSSCDTLSTPTVIVLLLDMWSERAQNEWLAAIQANIARLTLDPIWRTFPRNGLAPRTTTVAHLWHYMALYHTSLDHHRFSDTFAVDPTRIFYQHLRVSGLKQQWDALAELTTRRLGK
ncbi:hypothetical protein B5M09_004040 [Aphanomyces astaci]|nr:hypothetical protein B5M09_004040 [Aphanomyces astaci]